MRNYQFKVFIAFFLLASSLSTIFPAEATIHLPPKLIKSPSDLVYEVGVTGHQLVWQFEAHESADDPSTYNITVNGNLTVVKEVWQDKVDIIYNVDGLEIGVHIVKIIVSDNGVDTGAADPAEDEKTVTVVEEIATSESTSEQTTSSSGQSESTDFPLIMTFVALILVGVVVKKRKTR
ncbi:MAG: hypothetical protein ACXACK_18550 [Candidatus Hodarchaeales archaeon]|jgi:hypothetical protein